MTFQTPSKAEQIEREDGARSAPFRPMLITLWQFFESFVDMDSPMQPFPWPDPDVGAAAFVAPSATVLGAVAVAEGGSVWYGAVLRGDVERIAVGRYSNVQDGAILHGDRGQPTVLEEYVTVGHRAVVHSAYVERGCLIGIGAVVLNGVRVGAGSIVGAGAVVTKDVPPRSLVMGVPGKVVRSLSEEEAAELVEHAKKYAVLAIAHAGRGLDLGF